MLDVIKEQNPNLVMAATELHRKGSIPSDCYVVDLDLVESNSREIYESAKRLGLRTYVMTKQINRNPSMIETIIKSGFESFVAVDMECAYVLNEQNCKGRPVSNWWPTHPLNAVCLRRLVFGLSLWFHPSAL